MMLMLRMSILYILYKDSILLYLWNGIESRSNTPSTSRKQHARRFPTHAENGLTQGKIHYSHFYDYEYYEDYILQNAKPTSV
jgi:hypothetical protein